MIQMFFTWNKFICNTWNTTHLNFNHGKRSAFDPLSIKIRGISLHIIPRNYGILTFRSYSEMGFKLNENLLEPEPTTILPNVFSKVNLSHLWTETVLYRFVTSHVCSYMIPILDFMIQGLV